MLVCVCACVRVCVCVCVYAYVTNQQSTNEETDCNLNHFPFHERNLLFGRWRKWHIFITLFWPLGPEGCYYYKLWITLPFIGYESDYHLAEVDARFYGIYSPKLQTDLYQNLNSLLYTPQHECVCVYVYVCVCVCMCVSACVHACVCTFIL